MVTCMGRASSHSKSLLPWLHAHIIDYTLCFIIFCSCCGGGVGDGAVTVGEHEQKQYAPYPGKCLSYNHHTSLSACLHGHLVDLFSFQDSSINFDRLLSLGEDELASPTTTVNHEKKFETSSDRIIKYQGQLKVAAKKLKHLTELLRESEASALRLGDQAKVLKEEIRR